MTTSKDALAFDAHGHRPMSEGKIDGIAAVTILKNKTHTHTNSGIYTVFVLGEELSEQFRNVEDARAAGQKAFASRVSSLLSDDIIVATMKSVAPRPFHTAHFIDALRSARPELWKSLVTRYGEGGQGAGTHYSAFSAVAHALHRAASRGVLVKLENYVTAPPDLKWGSPVIRYWNGPGGYSDQLFPDEAAPQETYEEGAVTSVRVNRYERSEAARAACLSYYGTRCQGCDLDFGERYGERGKNFIHVHHLLPLKQIKKTYVVNPVEHLRPVCPNCHAMIHRREPMLSIDELRAMLK